MSFGCVPMESSHRNYSSLLCSVKKTGTKGRETLQRSLFASFYYSFFFLPRFCSFSGSILVTRTCCCLLLGLRPADYLFVRDGSGLYLKDLKPTQQYEGKRCKWQLPPVKVRVNIKKSL